MYFDRITIDPKVMGGNPCIRDTRIPVSLILKLLAKKETFENIIVNYTELTEYDIIACLNYAVWSVSETIIQVSG
jgi:uncharacterized protein (DUF433 family)